MANSPLPTKEAPKFKRGDVVEVRWPDLARTGIVRAVDWSSNEICVVTDGRGYWWRCNTSAYTVTLKERRGRGNHNRPMQLAQAFS